MRFLFLLSGVAIMYFSRQLGEGFPSQWGEQHIGSSKNMYLFIGFGLVLVGLLLIFGVVGLSSPA